MFNSLSLQTKQDILLALVNWLASSATESLDKMNEAISDPREKLSAFINARLATGETEMPEVVSAWIVIAGRLQRQSSYIRSLLSELFWPSQGWFGA